MDPAGAAAALPEFVEARPCDCFVANPIAGKQPAPATKAIAESTPSGGQDRVRQV
jgi:hypothetical protein